MIRMRKDAVMTIDCKRNGTEVVFALGGKLDTNAAPELDAVVKEQIVGAAKLSFDCTSREFLSSAGLRVFLGAQKIMNRQGSMEFHHVGESVRDVFALTGMLDVFTVIS